MDAILLAISDQRLIVGLLCLLVLIVAIGFHVIYSPDNANRQPALMNSILRQPVHTSSVSEKPVWINDTITDNDSGLRLIDTPDDYYKAFESSSKWSLKRYSPNKNHSSRTQQEWPEKLEGSLFPFLLPQQQREQLGCCESFDFVQSVKNGYQSLCAVVTYDEEFYDVDDGKIIASGTLQQIDNGPVVVADYSNFKLDQPLYVRFFRYEVTICDKNLLVREQHLDIPVASYKITGSVYIKMRKLQDEKLFNEYAKIKPYQNDKMVIFTLDRYGLPQIKTEYPLITKFGIGGSPIVLFSHGLAEQDIQVYIVAEFKRPNKPDDPIYKVINKCHCLHHIIPIRDLIFLWKFVHKPHIISDIKQIVRELCPSVKGNREETESAFAWSTWNLFMGWKRKYRVDDPADSDVVGWGGDQSETVRPRHFNRDLWTCIKRLNVILQNLKNEENHMEQLHESLRNLRFGLNGQQIHGFHKEEWEKIYRSNGDCLYRLQKTDNNEE